MTSKKAQEPCVSPNALSPLFFFLFLFFFENLTEFICSKKKKMLSGHCSLLQATPLAQAADFKVPHNYKNALEHRGQQLASKELLL